MAFCTLPPLRQRVQTYARVALPLRSTRTRWRFGLKRRLVATIEWLRLLPKPGPFPQMAQTLDIRPTTIARAFPPTERLRRAGGRKRPPSRARRGRPLPPRYPPVPPPAP